MVDISLLSSFIHVDENSDFPIQNLPYGIFRRKNTGDSNEYHVGVALGNNVIDLVELENRGIFVNTGASEKGVFAQDSLNKFMALGKDVWDEVRNTLTELLVEENPALKDNAPLREKSIIPMSEVEMKLPANIGDYTDFYSSKEHATNVGIMFRGKENALMPNWLHLPVAYHGRASSIVVSGTDIHRPQGQTKADDAENPGFGSSRLLDFELEMGFFVGTGNQLGHPIKVDDAERHIFGMVVVNDWSARDIQKWEYVPLGPFLAKNFATSISPWVVTMDALEPFRVEGPSLEKEPLPYLQNSGKYAYDINLEVYIQAENMSDPFRISHSNFKYLYWNMCQQLAHHTITGCNTNPGDLMASGTISGPEKDNYGSMLELTWRGSEPIKLPNGEERKFLQDGDTVIMKAYCQGSGYKVGFGEVRTKILPVI